MKIKPIMLCLLCLSMAATSGADELTLDNGNILKGKITEASTEAVTITSDYAEPIKVKKGRVSKINMDTPAEVHLINGEVLKGKLTTGPDGKVVVEQVKGRGPISLDWASVISLNPPLPKHWNGSITMGANSQSGNIDRAALAAGAEAVRTGENDRFSLRFLYNIAQSDGKMSTRNTFGAISYDYFFTKQFYGLVGVTLLNDTFQDLNLKTIVGPGVGYQLWDDMLKYLSLEAGIAHLSEDHKVNPDKSWMTARLSGNFKYHITDTILFSNQLTFYPSLEKLSDFQLRNEAAVMTSLGASWALKIANIIDYVKSPPVGVKKTDSNTILALQYGF